MAGCLSLGASAAAWMGVGLSWWLQGADCVELRRSLTAGQPGQGLARTCSWRSVLSCVATHYPADRANAAAHRCRERAAWRKQLVTARVHCVAAAAAVEALNLLRDSSAAAKKARLAKLHASRKRGARRRGGCGCGAPDCPYRFYDAAQNGGEDEAEAAALAARTAEAAKLLNAAMCVLLTVQEVRLGEGGGRAGITAGAHYCRGVAATRCVHSCWVGEWVGEWAGLSLRRVPVGRSVPLLHGPCCSTRLALHCARAQPIHLLHCGTHPLAGGQRGAQAVPGGVAGWAAAGCRCQHPTRPSPQRVQGGRGRGVDVQCLRCKLYVLLKQSADSALVDDGVAGGWGWEASPIGPGAPAQTAPFPSLVSSTPIISLTHPNPACPSLVAALLQEAEANLKSFLAWGEQQAKQGGGGKGPAAMDAEASAAGARVCVCVGLSRRLWCILAP